MPWGPRASAADEETHLLPTDGSRFTQEKRDCFSLAPWQVTRSGVVGSGSPGSGRAAAIPVFRDRLERAVEPVADTRGIYPRG